MATILRVKFALLSFVIFWIAAGLAHPTEGAWLGAIAAAAAFGLRRRTGSDGWLEATALAALPLIAVALGAGLLGTTAAVGASFLALGASCGASVLAGRPFTATHARAAWPGMSDTPQFVAVNRLLSSMWAAVFVYVGVARLLELPAWATWSAFLVAGVGSAVLPMWLVRRALLRRIAERAGPAWAPPTFPGRDVATSDRPLDGRATPDVDADVVVVGAGLGGLTAAALLAQSGLRVVVCEQHDVPGGFAHTWLRKGKDGDARPVFRFDSGIHDVSGVWDGAPVHGILERLGIGERIRWVRLERTEISDAGRRDVPATWDGYVAQLAERFPESAAGIRSAMADIATIHRAMYSLGARRSGVPGAPATVEGMLAFAKAHPLAVRWMDRPFLDFLHAHVDDRRAIDAITALSGYVTDDRRTLSVAQMVPLLGYYLHGGVYPAGGTGVISDTLAEYVEQHGGRVRLKTPVARVIVEQGEARGVELANGERIGAHAVVMNADFVAATTRLIDPRHWPTSDRGALSEISPACSAFGVHLGVRGRFEGAPALIQLHSVGKGVHIVLPTVADPSAAPDGYSTVELLRLVPASEARRWFADPSAHDDPAHRRAPDYLGMKRALGDELIALAEQALPGLRERIVFRCDASPVTFRRYAWSTDGAIYGSNAPQSLRYTRTPIRGLVNAGALTHGPGVEAVFISGALAAEALMPGLLARSAEQPGATAAGNVATAAASRTQTPSPVH